MRKDFMKLNKNSEYRNIIGTKLKEIRMRNNMTQQELAKEVQEIGFNMTLKEISKIETDKRLVQDFELFAFAQVFNISTDEFFK